MRTNYTSSTNSEIPIGRYRTIERSHQRKSIEAAIQSCDNSSGGFILIEGRFGTGKTTLLEFARESGTRGGFTVVHAGCSKYEFTFPYGLVQRIFEQLPSTTLSPEGNLKRTTLNPSALQLLERAGEIGISGQHERNLFETLLFMLGALSEHQSVLLLIDDVHWADPASIRFLQALNPWIKARRILCCATIVKLSSGNFSGQTLEIDLPDKHHLTVDNLSEDGVREYLGEICNGALSQELAPIWHEATCGNPALIRELWRETQGRIDVDSRSGVIPGSTTVASVVLPWINQVSGDHTDSALSLIRALSVLGSSGSLEQVAHVAELSSADASRAAGFLADIGLIKLNAQLGFVAPIVRKTIYDHLPQGFRLRAHYSAAQALASDGAPPEQVAEHLRHSPPGQDSQIAELLMAAGHTARQRGDFHAAVTYFRKAQLHTLPDGALSSLIGALGEAELRAGEPKAIEHLKQAMELTEDPIDQASVALNLSKALRGAARYREALTVLEAAHRRVRDHDEQLANRLHSEFVTTARVLPITSCVPDGNPVEGDLPSVPNWSDGRPAHRAYAALLLGESSERIASLCTTAVARGTQGGGSNTESDDLWLVAFCLSAAGRLDEAGALLDDAVQVAQTVISGPPADNLRGLRAHVNYKRGMLSEADSDAVSVLTGTTNAAARSAQPFAVLARINSLVMREQVDVASQTFERYSPRQLAPTQVMQLPLMIARGKLRLAQGDIEAGVQDLLRAHELLAAWGVRCPALAPSIHAVHGLVMLGQSERATRLAREHLSAARAFGAAHVLAAALCAHARCGEGRMPIELLEEAIEVLDGSTANMTRCTVLLQLGDALRRSGDAAKARRQLHAAEEMAHAIGATLVASNARRLLESMGSNPRETDRVGQFLTPREHRIAVLAAGGKRNKEIAHVLSAKVKTVEWHLSQVYRKLGIASRNELCRALTRVRALDFRVGADPEG